MILVITGDGKGKTTSAIGTAIRSAGWDNKTAIVFLDKGGDHYGEQKILDKLSDKIDVFRFGHERFNEKTGEFRFQNIKGDELEAEKALEKIKSLYDDNYFLIVCDEILTCIKTGLIPDSKVHELVEKCPKETHLILTGRDAPKWLIDMADMVSEVKEQKHYFKKMKKAIKGLDF
jgi:cob(I)alamin adenosyltransferase